MPKGTILRDHLTPEAVAIESVFQIKEKAGGIVPFYLNPTQARYDRQRTTRDAMNRARAGRDIINKARQQGFSAFVDADMPVNAFTKPYFRGLILAHVADSSQILFDRVKFYLSHPRNADQVPGFEIAEEDIEYVINPEDTLVENRKTIKFHNGSTIIVTTANSKNTAVGDTLDYVHASEVSKWKKSVVNALRTGLFQAVTQQGTIVIESTGEGTDNFFYDLSKASSEDPSHEYTQHFFPWFESPEYVSPEPEDLAKKILGDLREDLEEDYIAAHFKVTARQLLWRRRKLTSDFIENGTPNLSLFKKEYPATFIECFQTNVHAIFPKFNWMMNAPEWQQRIGTGLWKHEGHPRTGYTYVAGIDVAAGIRKDYTVLDIWCADTLEQVCQHRTNTMNPAMAAKVHAEIMWRYRAHAVPEANNHGYAYILALEEAYPRNLIFAEPEREDQIMHREDLSVHNLGFYTATGKKGKWISLFADFLATTPFKVYSDATAHELSNFTETDAGKLEGDGGGNDDCVMAGMLAFIGMSYLHLLPQSTAIVYGKQNQLILPELSNSAFPGMEQFIKNTDEGIDYGIEDDLHPIT